MFSTFGIHGINVTGIESVEAVVTIRLSLVLLIRSFHVEGFLAVGTDKIREESARWKLQIFLMSRRRIPW